VQGEERERERARERERERERRERERERERLLQGGAPHEGPCLSLSERFSRLLATTMEPCQNLTGEYQHHHLLALFLCFRGRQMGKPALPNPQMPKPWAVLVLKTRSLARVYPGCRAVPVPSPRGIALWFSCDHHIGNRLH